MKKRKTKPSERRAKHGVSGEQTLGARALLLRNPYSEALQKTKTG